MTKDEKAFEIIKRALDVVCTEESMDTCDCCPFYDPMCEEDPCELDHYAKPFMASIYDKMKKEEN